MISLREYLLQDLIHSFPLYEQAMNRNIFINKAMDIVPQLLAHWGLIEFAHGDFEDNDNYEEYVNHWKIELIAFCKKIAEYKIKGGKKENALKYMFINDFELNDWEVIYEMIRDKFEEENISLFECKKVAKYLSENINELIKVLSDKYTYREWIENL